MKKGWQTKTLGEILEKTETVNPLQSPDADFDYIDVSSVSNQTFHIEETQRLRGRDAPSRARRLVRANDILFATVRPTLQRIAIVPDELDNQVCSTAYVVLRPKPGFDHRFVFYSLFTQGFMDQMASRQKGASYPAVTDGEVRAQPLAFPPLPEQRRIVGILDEVFEGVATAKANAEQNIRNARAIFISHLQSVLSTRGSGWVDKPLGEFCSFENGDRGTNYPSKSARTLSGIPFINAGHLSDDGIDLTAMDFISRERFDLLSNGKIRQGDILFCLRGSLGKFASVGELSEGAVASSLVIVRPDDSVLHGFLLLYFRSHLCSAMIDRFKNGAAQPNLSAKSLREFIAPIPPIPIQESLVRRLAALSEGTNLLIRLYQRKLAALDVLSRSFLHQAFTGQL